MRTLIVMAGAALALAACGPSGKVDQGGRVVLKGPDGTVITAGKEVPANLPAYAKLYPGAEITSNVDMGGKGGIVTYTVAAPAETVMDFYKRSAAEAKLTKVTDSWGADASERSGAHVVAFNAETGDIGFTATVQQVGGKAQVTVIYGSH